MELKVPLSQKIINFTLYLGERKFPRNDWKKLAIPIITSRWQETSAHLLLGCGGAGSVELGNLVVYPGTWRGCSCTC